MAPRPRQIVCGLLLFFIVCPFLPASEGPEWSSDTLTGDWGGIRSNLFERGITLEVALKADVLSNVSGGLKRGTKYMDNWDVKLLADADTLWGLSGTTVYFQVISNHGGKLNETHVGSFMGVDSIEVGTHTTKFLHAWVEKNFFGDRFSILAGLYPVDAQFYVTDASAVFVQPTGGMGAEVAQAGVNGPSIFPTSAFGVRAMWQPTPKFYFQAALMDGVPGDPGDPHGTHIRFDHGDGAFAIVETGVRPAAHISKYAVGYWRYSARFDDLLDTDAAGDPVRRSNRGAYVLAEQSVYREKGDAAQGLALFFRYGVANGDINTLDYSYSLGLSYKGFFDVRDQDELGILLTRGHAGASFRQAAMTPTAADETALEITYRASVTPWLAIQPTLQRIVNPGFDAAVSRARVAGARFEIVF